MRNIESAGNGVFCGLEACGAKPAFLTKPVKNDTLTGEQSIQKEGKHERILVE
jgi:hypothetical protein